MLNKIRNNCRKATFLIDKKNLEGINVIEQIELHIHLTSCSLCRLYDKQGRIMNDVIRQLKQSDFQKIRLNEAFKKSLHDSVMLQIKKNLKLL
jgi:hypothetical protein